MPVIRAVAAALVCITRPAGFDDDGYLALAAASWWYIKRFRASFASLSAPEAQRRLRCRGWH